MPSLNTLKFYVNNFRNKYWIFYLQPDDPIVVRWSHLALLVECALELKKALQGINEQSFNHFVLKMGEFNPVELEMQLYI